MSDLFEIEATQEIWRTPTLTFIVLYPTHSTAAIKAMRGSFTKEEYVEIKRIFREKGFARILFERKRKDKFIEKVVENNYEDK